MFHRLILWESGARSVEVWFARPVLGMILAQLPVPEALGPFSRMCRKGRSSGRPFFHASF